MGGDPIPGPHDALRTWYMLSTLKKKEREEAIAKPETWHKKSREKEERIGHGSEITKLSGDLNGQKSGELCGLLEV